MKLKKITVPTAAEVCSLFELEGEAKTLLTAEQTPAQFLQKLIEGELFADAAHFMACALPKREAVWLASLAAHTTLGETATKEAKKAVQTAEAWVKNPSQESCQPNQAAAEAAGFATAAGLTAAAAFWSGDSMLPPDMSPVPPPVELTGQAVWGAITLAALTIEPEKAAEKYQFFTKQAIDIANGGSGKLN
ncbi:MAG: hypothetical protein L3J28_04570 [Candidatus Polarisedimenticolaceae bacterium]|nr:hypothetical protein [Candidatus Polarisedimenticolaceae bacterium]